MSSGTGHNRCHNKETPLLHKLNALFPIRYTVFAMSVLGMLLGGFFQGGWLLAICAALVVLGVMDLRQTRRSILRNYPVVGHLRFLLEYIRP